MRYLQNFFLLVYAVVYIWGWKLFLEIESLSYLKPYAYVLIVSAFLCLLLARIKKQHLFTGFFIGSFFGPLAAIIILLSEKDLRCYKKEEKDAEFYEKLYSKMANACFPVYDPANDNLLKKIQKQFFSSLSTLDVDFFVDYFKLKLNIPYQYDSNVRFDPLLRLREFKRVFIEFNNEYKLKFGSSFGKANEMIEKIDKRISEMEKINASIGMRQ